MSLTLYYSDVLTTAPTLEPVNVEDARRNLDLDDNYRDADVEQWIIEARKSVEHDARVALVNQTRTLVTHAFPASSSFNVGIVSPLVSVTSISYLDTAGTSQTLATTVYKVDTGRRPGVVWLKSGQTWPSTYDEANSVTVVYVAGHGAAVATVPEAAKQAIYLLVRYRLDNPEAFRVGFTEKAGLYGYEHCINQLRPGNYP